MACQARLRQQLGHSKNGRTGLVEVLDRIIPTTDKNVWVSCALGSRAKNPMRQRPHRTTEVGGVIHSDICGPISVPSIGGAMYFVTFIDEYSGYSVTIPLLPRRVMSVEIFSGSYHGLKEYSAALSKLFTAIIVANI